MKWCGKHRGKLLKCIKENQWFETMLRWNYLIGNVLEGKTQDNSKWSERWYLGVTCSDYRLNLLQDKAMNEWIN